VTETIDDEPPPGFLKSPAAIARWNREKAQKRWLRQQAYDLRKTNHSLAQIAAIQGCTIATARKRYEQAIKEYVPEELIKEIRAMELDRYDALQQTLLPMIEERRRLKDVDGFMKLFNGYLSVSDRRIKLTGAAAPVQVRIDGTIVQESEQDRELKRLIKDAEEVNREFDRMASAAGAQDEEPWTSGS